MRISIDITPLLLRSAGIKNHIYYWLLHLRSAAAAHEITTFPASGSFSDLNHERSQIGRGATAAGIALLHALNYLRPPADWFVAPADVFHASHQLRNPPRRPRLTTTIYDMTCWLMPEVHSPANVAASKWFGEHMMPRAAGLIAISASSRRDAIRILGLQPDRIEVIYPGIPGAFFAVSGGSVQTAREKHRLARPFALFVGTIEPRKNVAALLEAWAGLGPSIRDEYDLVVVGPAGWGEQETLARLEGGIPGVRYLGYVPESDLPGITAGAAAFVYPSLYEGFGFPVAQAMACGVPAITSNVSSLPEVAGDAAVLVDPHSVSEIRRALDQVLSSPSVRSTLGANGRLRAAAYNWRACAERSLRFFERARG